MEIITRRGRRSMSQAEFTKLRSQYSSTLVDLGTGDGAWPRRFAREYNHCLAIGVDSDRTTLKAAAKMAERKPARGGAPNALYIAAQAESLPPELKHSADWVTIYFPWAALLRMILDGDPALVDLLRHLSAPRARLSLVLNAEAPPEGYAPPTPQSLSKSLTAPLAEANYRIVNRDWRDKSEAPQTTWAGRLVKGSSRAMLGIEALRRTHRA